MFYDLYLYILCIFIQADTMLYLADEQLQLDLTHDALYNYHAACVFYRVMEPMIPPAIASIQNSKLIYASEQIKKFSSYEQNMILQNMIAVNFEEKYHLYEKKLLGSGTYGSVYLATHHMTGIQRAVKVLDIERITSYNLRKIHNEIMILRSLDHPNIIKLHDVFISDRQGN